MKPIVSSTSSTVSSAVSWFSEASNVMQSHPALAVGILTRPQCGLIYSLDGVLLEANRAMGTMPNRRDVLGLRVPQCLTTGVRRVTAYLT